MVTLIIIIIIIIITMIIIDPRRESWVGYSTYQAWQGLVLNTKQTSKDHAVLSEILNNLASARLGEIGEDMQRIYKKVVIIIGVVVII